MDLNDKELELVYAGLSLLWIHTRAGERPDFLNITIQEWIDIRNAKLKRIDMLREKVIDEGLARERARKKSNVT